MVDFLLALVEFDGRRLWEDLGFGSLFDYLHRELAMSAGSAFYRKTAVRLLHFFPEIVDPLRDGRLCVSSLPEIAKVLTRANSAEVLPQFFHRSTREAKEVSAALAPNTAPAQRDVVTVLTAPRVASPNVMAACRAESLAPRPGEVDSKLVVGTDVAMTSSSPPSHDADLSPRPTQPFHALEVGAVARDVAVIGQQGSGGVQRTAVARNAPCIEADGIEPLTADLRRLHFTVSREFLRKLDAARALLSHRHPSGRAGDVLEAALDILLDRHAARKTVRRRDTGTANTDRKDVAHRTRGDAARASRTAAVSPESKQGASGSGRGRAPVHRGAIPASIRKAVLERDDGRCQFKLHDGSICGSTVRIEVDHVTPRSMRGPPTMENLRALCRVHNQLAARRFFGETWMEQFGSGTDRSRRGDGRDRRPAGVLPSRSRSGQDRAPR